MKNKQKPVIYLSWARWRNPETGWDQESRDEHDSRKMAIGVTKRLMNEYGKKPCPIRGLCIESWVEKIDLDPNALSGRIFTMTKDMIN